MRPVERQLRVVERQSDIELVGPAGTDCELSGRKRRVEDARTGSGCVHQVTMHGWEHRVYDLFEVVVDVGLPLLCISSDATLGEEGSTWMRSSRRFTRSRSGSSEVACCSS